MYVFRLVSVADGPQRKHPLGKPGFDRAQPGTLFGKQTQRLGQRKACLVLNGDFAVGPLIVKLLCQNQTEPIAFLRTEQTVIRRTGQEFNLFLLSTCFTSGEPTVKSRVTPSA